MMVLLTRKYPANLCLYTPWRKIIHGISHVFWVLWQLLETTIFRNFPYFPHGASCGMPRETREALPHCQNWELHHAGVRLSPTQRFAIPTRWPAFFLMFFNHRSSKKTASLGLTHLFGGSFKRTRISTGSWPPQRSSRFWSNQGSPI